MSGLMGALAAPRNAEMSSLDFLKHLGGWRPSKSGESVTTKTALEVTTVLDCVRVLAEGVSQVDLNIKKRLKDGGSEIAVDHPLQQVLAVQPNPWQSSFTFRETMMFHLALTNDFVAFKNKSMGVVEELIPFEPERVSITRLKDGRRNYKVSFPDGASKDFPDEAIWHVTGPSWNSWSGLPAVQMAKEAIGLALAAESTQAKMHKNSLRMSGVYSVEGNLPKPQYLELRAFIEEHTDPDQAFKPLIIDRNGKFTQTNMSGVDAQHIETRKHQVEEICRAFRVMPVMVGHPADMAARAAMEQIFIAHVTHTLMPWYKRIEQAILIGLMTPADRKKHFADFDEYDLLRGAMKDQAEYFSKALGAGGGKGWLTQNDVRRRVGENPLPDGDDLPQPATSAAPAGTGSDSEEPADVTP